MDLVELAHEVITLSNQDGNKVSSTPGDTPPHILPARFHRATIVIRGLHQLLPNAFLTKGQLV